MARVVSLPFSIGAAEPGIFVTKGVMTACDPTINLTKIQGRAPLKSRIWPAPISELLGGQSLTRRPNVGQLGRYLFLNPNPANQARLPSPKRVKKTPEIEVRTLWPESTCSGKSRTAMTDGVEQAAISGQTLRVCTVVEEVAQYLIKKGSKADHPIPQGDSYRS